MPTREELEDALAQCQEMPSSFENCWRMMVFDYMLHRFDGEEPEPITAGYESDSEFYRIAQEIDPVHLFATIDELVGCVEILDARLYKSFIEKLREGRE